MSCFQCDLDIVHVCYAGQPRARWGWTDEAIATLEAAQHALFPVRPVPAPSVQGSAPPERRARRSVLKSKRRPR
jgi:hypothetical protein